MAYWQNRSKRFHGVIKSRLLKWTCKVCPMYPCFQLHTLHSLNWQYLNVRLLFKLHSFFILASLLVLFPLFGCPSSHSSSYPFSDTQPRKPFQQLTLSWILLCEPVIFHSNPSWHLALFVTIICRVFPPPPPIRPWAQEPRIRFVSVPSTSDMETRVELNCT